MMAKKKKQMPENPLKKVGQEIEEVVDKAEDMVKKIKKPLHKRVSFWLIIIFFIVIIIGGLIYYSTYVPLKRSVTLARRTQAYFEKAQTDLLSANFNQAKKDIQTAQILLERLESNVSRLDSPLMVGYLRNQYNAIENIVAATKEFSDGLYLLTGLTQDVLSNIETKNGNLIISSEQRREILQKFSKKTPELNGAKAQIDLSLLRLKSIQISKLNPNLAKYVLSLRTKLSLLRNFLDKSVSLSQSLPILLGLNHEKTYLFLLQNNNELRPTGGFIGTVGILKVKDGKIISFLTHNVYDYDKYAHKKLFVSPPKPIKKYLKVDGWYLRDSNWSPDFVEAAKKIEWFYHKESSLSNGNLANEKIDGIIAVTPKIVQDFLGIVGAVELNSFIFNKDNFVDQLQYLVETGYKKQNVPYWQRKNIIGDLAQKLIKRTENLNIQGWLNLTKSIFNNLNQKQILIYSKDAVIQNLIEQQNWSGALKKTAGDYLLVVDANLASLKSNQCVTRDIKYNLNADLTARVEINYKNNCAFTWKSTRYRTYTRVYVPLGSKLIKTTGAMEIDRSNKTGQTDVMEENKKTVFGAFISIEPHERGTLSFEYKLPNYLVNKLRSGGEYDLYCQKQAGTLKDRLILDLKFPHKIQSTYPSEPRKYWGDNKYRLSTNLETDKEIKIGF